MQEFTNRKRKRYILGMTLVELLTVVAILGILLAIAIPNILKARMSANEANAKKALQTLRDAEFQYFVLDLDNDGFRDFTNRIGFEGDAGSLRQPGDVFHTEDALIDATFEGAIVNDGNTADAADCIDPKAGYCLGWSSEADTDRGSLTGDFGWEASARSSGITGRRDFSMFADKVIRCSVSTQSRGTNGRFEAERTILVMRLDLLLAISNRN